VGKLVFASPGGNGSAFSLGRDAADGSTGIEALMCRTNRRRRRSTISSGGHVDLSSTRMPVEVASQAANVRDSW